MNRHCTCSIVLPTITVPLTLRATCARGECEVFSDTTENTSTNTSSTTNGREYNPAQTDAPWWYYFPSLAVNKAGDLVMGFSGSTATNYISAFYTWRVGCGFTLDPPVLLQAGTVKPGVTRWGDYSATTLDPADGFSAWTVQEYAEPVWYLESFWNRWGTVAARITPHL